MSKVLHTPTSYVLRLTSSLTLFLAGSALASAPSVSYTEAVYVGGLATNGIDRWEAKTTNVYSFVEDSASGATWTEGCWVVGRDYDENGVIDADDAVFAAAQETPLKTTFTISNTATVNGKVTLILVDGFTLTVTGSRGYPGVQVTGDNTITICGQTENSGKLNATAGAGGAGIGSASTSGDANMNGAITIDGGTVYASCGSGVGAGIGGGGYKEGRNITINGGNVKADSAHGGGLGGGKGGNGHDITINGGDVVTTASMWGSGIGGGGSEYSNCGGFGYNIRINGGSVIATTYAYSSGGDAIGGGRNKSAVSHDIYISTEALVRSGPTAQSHQPVVNTGADLASALNGKNYATVASPPPHQHCLCGASGSAAHCAATHDKTEFIWTEWTATDSLPTSAGYWYLANDVTLSATYTPPTGVNLCLNGHVVNGNGACTLVKLNGGAAFTLTDCDKTTTHNFSVDANGLWTLTDTAKTVDYEDLTARPNAGDVVALTGGALTGGYINDYGTGGVLVNGVFTMYGGNLVGNCNMAKHGGAVYIGQSNSYSVTLAGGRICGNYAAGCGGAVQQDGSCVSNLRLCGTDVSFNAAGNKGGAVNSDSAVTVTGGRIAYNKAAGLGSAMNLSASSAAVSMTGGSITHNESSESGSCGAVCFAGSLSYVIGGTLLLDENYTAGNERNLYLASGQTVSISTTTPLAEGAQIGVTTATEPTALAPVAVTDDTGNGAAKYFTSDAGHDVFNVGAKVYVGTMSKYYVSRNGDDSTGDGTVANPYKTIAKALDMVGDKYCTVCVMTDLVEPTFFKTFTGNVTITSDDGDPATVGEKFTVYAGSAVKKCWHFRAGTVYLENMTFDGRVGGPAGTTKAEGAFYGDRDTTRAKGATLNLRNGLTVQNFRAAADTANGGNCIITVQDYSTLNIEDGVLLTGNIVDEGKTSYSTNPNSVVCAGGNSTLYIKGGKITGNVTTGPVTAIVYLGTNIKAYISGGEIFGNTMYATDSYALFKRMSSATAAINAFYYFSGSPRVFDNYDTNGNQKNFHRPDNTYLYLDGALTQDAKIGISSVATPTAGAKVAEGQSGYTVTASDADKLFDDCNTLKIVKHTTENKLVFDTAVTAVTLTLDTLTTTSLTGTFGEAIDATANDITVFKDGVKMESGYTVTVSGTALTIDFAPAFPEKVTIGVAVSKNGYTVNNGKIAYIGLHKHCVCGDGACTAAGHTHAVLDWKLWTSNNSLPTTAGNWYLMNDVTLTAEQTIEEDVNLCLNGHVVKQTTSGQRIVTISSGATFQLTDCGTNVVHNFKVGSDGLWTLTTDTKTVDYENLTARPAANAVVAVKGGAITGGDAGSGNGGGICSYGDLNLFGGNLIGNKANDGGGVFLSSSSTLNMFGGKIVGCVGSGDGGGLYAVAGANTTISGKAEISYDTAREGAGITYAYDGGTGNLTMTGGKINGNMATHHGCGALRFDGDTFTMTGGEISGNTAKTNGGGVYMIKGSFIMTGGEIHGNTAEGTGSNGKAGGVFFRGKSMTVGGTAKVYDNFGIGCAVTNNVYIPSGKTIAISTTTPLAAGAQIGVTTEVKPSTTAQLVPVTSNRGEDLSYFTSDEGHLVVNEAGKVQLKFALNVAFHANHADVTRDGAAFSSTNAVITYGSTDGIPTLACEGLVMVGWAKTAGATEPEYTDAQVATISTVSGSSHTLYAVWKAEVRIPVFVALDGFSVVPTDGRTYEVAITNGNVETPLQPCCTNLVLACPIGTGDVYRVGFGTNDVTNPWTLALGNGTYIYDIRHKTKARPGEKIKSGIWRTTVAVDTATKPYAKITNDEFFEDIDELGDSSFDVCIAWGLASFSSEGRYLILGDDNQKNISKDAANRALVKSSFAFDFTRNFSIDGKINIGNAADGSAIGFVPNGAKHTTSDFSGPGSDLGVYGVKKNGKGLFLELDAYSDGSSPYNGAHLSLTTTDANGKYTHCSGQYATFSGNYTFPTETLNYSITYDCKTKKMVFKISSTTKAWTFNYTNPTALFGSTKAYMILSGNLRYGGGYGASPAGAPAPKTKITIANFTYQDELTPGTVDNTFRNRQEAKISYNAWGGCWEDGVETNDVYAVDACVQVPTVPTRAGGYNLEGWFTSWTNGAAAVVEGTRLDPIADGLAYAKWTSPSVPREEGEKVIAFEKTADGDGAILKGATNTLENTDLAIPEFTSNGAEGIPFVTIKEGAFKYRNYDKLHPAKKLTSATISMYVTNIQSYAFAACQSLTNVTFSRTRDYKTGALTRIYVGDNAFKESAVETIVFPADADVELDYGAFTDAQALRDVYLLGDVKLAATYPFMGAGRHNVYSNGAQIPVRIHLSAKNAADPAFVAALTNGMSAARVVLDQEIIGGKLTICEGPAFAGDTVSFTFKVESDSQWLTVETDTVYLFYSTTSAAETFIGNEPKKPTSLVQNVDGSWTAVFAKPDLAGSTMAFYQLCIGD